MDLAGAEEEGAHSLRMLRRPGVVDDRPEGAAGEIGEAGAVS